MCGYFANANSGDYRATFVDASEYRYPKGSRLLVHYLLLEKTEQTPLLNDQGDEQYAAAVCNVTKGDNPKSTPYKIRKAMLEAEEFNPIDAAIRIPGWDHFKQPINGRLRTLGVRVERQVNAASGKAASIVT